MNALDLTLRGQAAAIAAGEVDPRELLDAALARRWVEALAPLAQAEPTEA